MTKRWPTGAEAVLQADRLAELADLVVAELDDRVALGAMQVVVRRVAVVVLVGGPVGQPELAEQARLDQEPKGPVDRRPADPAAGVVQVGDQLVGVEVLVRVEDVADQDPPRLGQLLAPDLEELAELLLRALRDQRAGRGRRGRPRAFVLGRRPGPAAIREPDRAGVQSRMILILADRRPSVPLATRRDCGRESAGRRSVGRSQRDHGRSADRGGRRRRGGEARRAAAGGRAGGGGPAG